MSDFKEFMNEVEESPVKALLASNAKPPEIHLALKAAVGKLLAPTSLSVSEQQKVSEEVSNLVKDKAFLSEFSDQIGEPLENESEDEFVERGKNVLRRMLYNRFGIDE